MKFSLQGLKESDFGDLVFGDGGAFIECWGRNQFLLTLETNGYDGLINAFQFQCCLI